MAAPEQGVVWIGSVKKDTTFATNALTTNKQELNKEYDNGEVWLGSTAQNVADAMPGNNNKYEQ